MNLKPFNEFPPLVHKAKNGIAVQVLLDVEDFYKRGENHHARHYLTLLGFEQEDRDKLKWCTILSEITNMPGHYVVVGKNNQIVCGLHSDIFYVDLEDICD